MDKSSRSGPLESTLGSSEGRLSQTTSDPNSPVLSDISSLSTSSPVFENRVNGFCDASGEPREKKSSFQITRVVSRNGIQEDGDSIDDRTGVEDQSSDLTDVSQSTNVVTNIDSEDTMYSSMEDVATGVPPAQDELKEKDVQSRFRVVKIDHQDGVKHGRWICLDFNDSVLLDKSPEEGKCGSNSASLMPENVNTCVQQGVASNGFPTSNICDVNSELHQSFDKRSHNVNDTIHGSLAINVSPLTRSSTQPSLLYLSDSHVHPQDLPFTEPSLSSPLMDLDVGKECNNDAFTSSDSNSVENCDFVSRFQSFQFVTENLLSNMTRKRSEVNDAEIVDESGASAVAIDNKIEQAMDLVKSHLMFAVREEVEQLKLKIQELTERNGRLEYENTILRASAPQETLAKLQLQQQQQPTSSMMSS